MDKDTITGLMLMGLLLIGFSWWSQPSSEQKAEMMRQDSVAAIMKQKAKTNKENAELKHLAELKAKQETDTTALFHKALQGETQDIVLQNEKLQLTLNTKGGAVTKAVIKGFEGREGDKNVTLLDEKIHQLNFTLSAKDTNIATQGLFFQPSTQTDSTVTLTANAGQGKSMVLTYKLGPNYLLHMSMRVDGMNDLFAPDTKVINVNWKDKYRQQEKGFTFENRYSTLTYHEEDGGTDKLSETSEKVDEQIDKEIDWVAFKNQFFSAMMIAEHDFNTGALLTSIPQQKGSGFLKECEAKLKTFFGPTGQTPSEFEFCFGPNDFRLLNRVEQQSTFNKDLELQRLIYLGWPLFRIINRWFTIYVFG